MLTVDFTISRHKRTLVTINRLFCLWQGETTTPFHMHRAKLSTYHRASLVHREFSFGSAVFSSGFIGRGADEGGDFIPGVTERDMPPPGRVLLTGPLEELAPEVWYGWADIRPVGICPGSRTRLTRAITSRFLRGGGTGGVRPF